MMGDPAFQSQCLHIKHGSHEQLLVLLQVITVNQVVDILSRVQAGSGWKEVLQAVLPSRKRAEADDRCAQKPSDCDREGPAADKNTQEDGLVKDVACTDTRKGMCPMQMKPGADHPPTSKTQQVDDAT